MKLLYYIAYLLDPFCTQIFFFVCVLPSLYFEKLKLCPILLMLDWLHARLSG